MDAFDHYKDGEGQEFGPSLTMEFRGGSNDGLFFRLEQDSSGPHWVSDSFPGKRFKQVFVPIEMEHPDFVGD